MYPGILKFETAHLNVSVFLQNKLNYFLQNTGDLQLSRLSIQMKNSTSDTPSDCIISYPVTASADSYTDIYCDLLSSTKLISITGPVSDITAIAEVQVYGPRKFMK